VRSVVYRFPDLADFERLVRGALVDPEFWVPAGEVVDDGEWVLAIFELGPGRRATSVAGRATVSPEGARLVFEPRDLRRLAEFARHDARSTPPPPPAVSAPARPSRPPIGGGAPARVLLVDDDPDIRDVVSAMLEAVGLEVEAVATAEDGLGRISSGAFDLLVLDWNLPKMSGLDLCRLIRREPALAELPVLFLTANASSQDMVEAFAGGADDYVVKPFRAPELGARIFSLLRRSRK
jgi:two-component system phosphate regulon response regulator PhoB